MPKKSRASDSTNFKHIGLVSSICKLLTKVLAKILKGQWKGSLVSKRENAPAITGKFWTSELNVDECLDSRMRSSCSWVICKLDKKNK